MKRELGDAAVLQLTVPSRLAARNGREDGGVPGKRGGGPGDGAEDLQISSHGLLAKMTLFAVNTGRGSEQRGT